MRVSKIGSDGIQHYVGEAEEPKFNGRGLWHNFKGFAIDINHKNGKSILKTFDWVDGAPINFQVVQAYNEVIDPTEVDRVLTEHGLADYKETKPLGKGKNETI